jgi:hypothetical protein
MDKNSSVIIVLLCVVVVLFLLRKYNNSKKTHMDYMESVPTYLNNDSDKEEITKENVPSKQVSQDVNVPFSDEPNYSTFESTGNNNEMRADELLPDNKVQINTEDRKLMGENTKMLRNANLQLREDPPNPRMDTGPFNQSTIQQAPPRNNCL